MVPLVLPDHLTPEQREALEEEGVNINDLRVASMAQKGRDQVRPYIREGHPVAGYSREVVDVGADQPPDSLVIRKHPEGGYIARGWHGSWGKQKKQGDEIHIGSRAQALARLKNIERGDYDDEPEVDRYALGQAPRLWPVTVRITESYGTPDEPLSEADEGDELPAHYVEGYAQIYENAVEGPGLSVSTWVGPHVTFGKPEKVDLSRVRRTASITSYDEKARVQVRPYIREGRPVVGYEREQELAQQLADDAVGLIQGTKKRGKGRQGLKRPRRGWREYVEHAHRTFFPLQQNRLVEQRRQAMNPKPFELVKRDDGVVEYREGDRRIIYRPDNSVDVYLGHRHLAHLTETFGPSLPDMWNRALTESGEQTPERQFLDEWFGGPGRPGKYERSTGDPGVLFVEQHQQIMEAGARMDAELTYRTRQEIKDLKDAQAHRKTLEKELILLYRKQDQMQSAIAVSSLVQQGWTWEAATPDRIKRDSARWQAEIGKGPLRQDHAVMDESYPAYNAWRNAELSEPVQEIEHKVDALFRGEISTADDSVSRAYDALVNARREHAYAMLREIRPFGTVRLDFSQSSAVASPALQAAQVWLPSDWIAASNSAETHLFVKWTEGRGRYLHVAGLEYQDAEPNSSAVVVSGSDSSKLTLPDYAKPAGLGTAIHELAHRAEWTRDGLRGMEWVFYVSRVSPGVNRAWEPTVKLSDITGSPAYEDNEVTRSDDFVNVYSGKDYAGQPPGAEPRASMENNFEILSMGIEDLVTGGKKILDQDDEYRQFVLGVLALG